MSRELPLKRGHRYSLPQGSSGRRPRVRHHLPAVSLSLVSLAALEAWALHPQSRSSACALLDSFVKCVNLINLNQWIAERAGRLASRCRSKGFRIPLADVLVAATAIMHQMTFVTHLVAH